MLEVILALVVWMILSTGLFAVFAYVSNSSTKIMQQHHAFENARAALNGLIVNIQLAYRIHVQTGSDDVLKKLSIWHPADRTIMYGPDGLLYTNEYNPYVFTFDRSLSSASVNFQRLNFGGNNEFASGIANIQMVNVMNRRMEITIKTACVEPIVLMGSVCIRYKQIDP